MEFHLTPILADMKELYLQPISADRFRQYLSKLQGDTKGDLSLPISGFNPMGQVLEKIEELEHLGAEAIMAEAIGEINSLLDQSSGARITMVLNLADDLKGGWTNFYTTDFDSKFKLQALVRRNFCAPYFWTSESYSEHLVRARTREYAFRTIYWQNNSKPITLEDHVEQEIFVSANAAARRVPQATFDEIAAYYEANKQSKEYNLIFNFFYGDAASESLGYKQYGIADLTGYQYAAFVAQTRKTTS